jgi:hypothetical protein
MQTACNSATTSIRVTVINVHDWLEVELLHALEPVTALPLPLVPRKLVLRLVLLMIK